MSIVIYLLVLIIKDFSGMRCSKLNKNYYSSCDRYFTSHSRKKVGWHRSIAKVSTLSRGPAILYELYYLYQINYII